MSESTRVLLITCPEYMRVFYPKRKVLVKLVELDRIAYMAYVAGQLYWLDFYLRDRNYADA